MRLRRTEDEHTASGAIIRWSQERPRPDYVLVTYPCCGRTEGRRMEHLPRMRRSSPLYCMPCYAQYARGEHAYQWLGDAISPDGGRARARRQYPDLGPCQHCGERPATERHHKDGNPANNDPDNVLFTCRRCHMLLDGRLYQSSKLTPEQVRAIRQSGEAYALLAACYGVSIVTIGRIRRRECYAWVSD